MHDYLGDKAANYKLMQDIINWWAKRGYTVKAWLEKSVSPVSGHTIWMVRTNIVQDVKSLEKKHVV